MALGMLFFAVFLTALPQTRGCGQLPFGQERTINFNLSNFILPASMAYSQDMAAPSVAPRISKTADEAKGFVQRLMRQLLDGVLYEQGRSALLSDDVISAILRQIDVSVTHEPLKCDKVFMEFNANVNMADVVNCLVVNGGVTKTCTFTGAMDCSMPANVKPVPPLSITGSVRTTNVIMANWSNEMWQIVLNRVVRSLRAGPLSSNFFKASITIN